MSEESPPQLTGFLAGSRLAGYRLETQLGAGGMAVVFRARDERLGRLVALKILTPGLAADSAFRQRFIAESRAAAAVDDPHIIPVYEAGEAGGVLFIAMRLVQGGDLREVLAREGALPPDRAADFISPVASALDAAHRVGLVHRDVKPANVLVDAREDRPDHVYLSDFGVSKGAMSAVGLTAVGMFVGTPDYSAPEQIEGRIVDGRTDQYALACVTYQLLTGTIPYEREQGMAVLLAHMSQPPPSVVSRRPELPAAVDQVVAKGMAKVPEERYESCRDFADALRDALGLTPYHRRGPATAPRHRPFPAASPPEARPPSEAPPSSEAPPPSEVPSRSGAPSPAVVPVESGSRGSTVDSVPGRGSAGVAEVPAAIQVTGPGSPGREADDDAGTARPRWRRPRRVAARKRRDPAPTPAAAREGMPLAVATAAAESQAAADLGTSEGSVKLASPPDPGTSPPEIPSLAAAVAVTPADLGIAVEPDLGAVIQPGPGSATADAVPGGGPPATAEVPTVSPVSRPGLPGGKADGDAGAAPPATVIVAEEGLPAAVTAAAAETQPIAARRTAAGWGQPASPPLPVASPSRIPPPAATATEAPAMVPVTAPGRVGREKDHDATTTSPEAGPDGLTDPGSGAGVIAPARHPQPSVVDRPSTIPAWIRRHRLPVFAVMCAILAAAVALPFVVTSAAHSPSRGTPTTRGSSPGPANSPIYRRAGINLPAGYQGLVSSLAFSPSGGTLAIAAYGVCLWNIATASCIPGARLTTAYSVAFSPDGSTLAAGDDNNGSTYLWNVAAKRLLVATLPDPASEGVDSVAFSPDGKTLAVGDANGRTYLWNIATQKLIATLTDSPSKGVQSVVFSPDGKTLAAGDANGRTYLWDVATDKPIASLADPGGKAVDSVAFSPDGKILAAGDVNGSAYLWDVATDKPIASLADSGSKGVESVAFSPDGKILAAGDANGSAYLWNVVTDRPITILTDPGSAGIDSVAFSPDGRTLACADQNNSGSVYVWHIS